MLLKLHRKLWDWLVKYPDMGKSDWPDWCNIVIHPLNFCFACQFDRDHRTSTTDRCDLCPLDWSIYNFGSSSCQPGDPCMYSLYGSWSIRSNELFDISLRTMRPDVEERREGLRMELIQLARSIRDIPIKEEWKTHPEWNLSLLM